MNRNRNPTGSGSSEQLGRLFVVVMSGGKGAGGTKGTLIDSVRVGTPLISISVTPQPSRRRSRLFRFKRAPLPPTPERGKARRSNQ